MIKGISEYADGSSVSSDAWRRFASVMAASLTVNMLSEPLFSKRGLVMEVRLEIISWTERFKTIFSLSRGVVYLFCNQGHPMTVFCTISVRISK